MLCVLLFSFKKEEDTQIRILFTGDILLSRNVAVEYTSGKNSPWEDLQTIFQSADLVVGNLEGAVGNHHSAINPLQPSPVFAIDSNHIPLLYEAGFHCLTLENNHSLDLGIDGKEKTIETLRKNKLTPITFDNSPCFIPIKDIVISIIAVNNVLSRDSSRQTIPSIELRQKIRLAKQLSNIVIVSIHWGSELLEWPNKEQRKIADWLTLNGVDIIIGMHPHVIQKPEIINGKPVFFSLGNHLFDQKYDMTKEGLVAEIVIKNGKYTCSAFKTQTKKNSFYPQYVENYDFQSSAVYNTNLLTVNDYVFRGKSLPENNMYFLQTSKENQFAWKSHQMPLISALSSKLDSNNEYLFTLEKHYSSIDKEITIRPYVYSVDSNGLLAKWRGSALAWPLLDAEFSSVDSSILCGLHRGDSFLMLNPKDTTKRIAAYQWNGFGFSALPDSLACKYCQERFE